MNYYDDIENIMKQLGNGYAYMSNVYNKWLKENDNKTIGIIIVKENNEYIIKYSSDKRIKVSTYVLL